MQMVGSNLTDLEASEVIALMYEVMYFAEFAFVSGASFVRTAQRQ